jgi:hypothetical protein
VAAPLAIAPFFYYKLYARKSISTALAVSKEATSAITDIVVSNLDYVEGGKPS